MIILTLVLLFWGLTGQPIAAVIAPHRCIDLIIFSLVEQVMEALIIACCIKYLRAKP